MHYGTTSGHYDNDVDVGNHNSCTISGIEKDRDYFYAVTAYSDVGESDYSEEIVHRINSEPNTSIDPIVEPDPTGDPAVEPDPTTDPIAEPDPTTDPIVEPDPTADPPAGSDPAGEPLDEVIVDNGDEGTFSSGTWKNSRYSDPYGKDALFSRSSGSRYGFEAAINGDYVVFLRWNEYRRSCRSVPVEIYDDDVLLETVEVNQRTGGGQWNELGGYIFNGSARVVVISEGRCVTGVDAVEFVSQDLLSPSIYQITSTAGAGGSISPDGEMTVSAGSSATCTIEPNAGYHIADVRVDGNSMGAVTEYTFEKVSGDHTITASFEADATVPDSSGSYSYRRHREWSRWWRWRR
jgi:hypothetical protein